MEGDVPGVNKFRKFREEAQKDPKTTQSPRRDLLNVGTI